VEVEVVLGHVADCGDVEAAALDATKFESMGRNLHHDGFDAASAHVAQRALEIEALGCGVQRTFADVRVADFNRTDQADSAIGASQDRLDQVGRARLAVGPRDPEQVKLGAW